MKKLIKEYASIMIALTALILASYQGYLNRYHNRLSVKPYLTFEIDNSKDSPFLGITVANEGLGTAKVYPFNIYVDGKLIEGNNWDAAIQKLGFTKEEKSNWVETYSIDNLSPWEKGITRGIFGIKNKNYEKVRGDRIKKALERVNVAMCYCSMYDECDFISIKEIEVNVCELAKAE